MLLNVQGAQAYCYTGGKAFDAQLPTLVFLHGAQNDHSVWGLQSRYLAHHGYSVLAVDLPGHGRSKGAAKRSVEELADWLVALLDAAGVLRAALIGHSMGSLIALEAAQRAPQRVSHLALLGSTYPMKVSDALLDAARSEEQTAIDMVNIWSLSSQTMPCAVPGVSLSGSARRLMQRMSRLNPEQLFHTDFSACNAYTGGEAAARAVNCPTLLVFGGKDIMTPPKSTKLLRETLAHAQTVQVDAGHQMMAEQPDAVLAALRGFLNQAGA
ncbi:alpha/beta fold hydrolase [Massilia sp. erpn]|uniref:alpha/beta fold hydrolase n=1 Tax=Massilia sp. erpn TaxID=2738142 RepID=UPI002105EF53|nr:alpha/beta hydrolase [Massilia sp. erpn]UTY59760.1 alpha/beta hydrolase [Massilia sp. erpn]